MQLPFVNMVLVGAEEHQQWNDGERELYSTSKEGTMLGNSRTDMRRIIQTETDQVVLRDINLRLLGSKTATRRVALRSITVRPAPRSWSAGRRAFASSGTIYTLTSTSSILTRTSCRGTSAFLG